MEVKTESSFERLAKINVNDKVEKKGGLSYLSWPWAVDQLLRADPSAGWAYQEPTLYGETMMVHCTVIAFGKTMSAHLPVMDHRNKPIAKPDAFQVNTAMQRCLVKAIALHGLGLYIYAGEDLPEGEKSESETHGALRPGDGNNVIAPTSDIWEKLPLDMQNHLLDIAHRISTLLKKGDIEGAAAELTMGDSEMLTEQKVGLWSRLDSKERSALSKQLAKQKAEKQAA